MAILYDRAFNAWNEKRIQCFLTPRPWLDLYGVNIRPVVPEVHPNNEDSALIHRKLPEELLHEIFIRMSPYTLGRASCVCKRWKYTLMHPIYWRVACLNSWQKISYEENERILTQQYKGSWRRMWQERPRVRSDGIYVSRNTYFHTGVVEWKVKNPVHLVCYFRYFRFFPGGKFLYQVSPDTIKHVAKKLNRRSAKENIFGGEYSNIDDLITAAIVYTGLKPTVVRFCLRLRGTCRGANNRIDVVSLISGGLDETEASHGDEELLKNVEKWRDDETHNPDVPAVSHQRAVAPFVFVPFEEVETSVLNLPVETMDYYLPG